MSEIAAPTPPPVTKALPSSRTRGEGDASAVWTGHRQALRTRNCRAKPLDASGGGVWLMLGTITPTRNAIGLGLPVVLAVGVADGSPSPWHSILPPHAHRRPAFDAGGGKGAADFSTPQAELAR
jgi:hypothetical protein